MGNILMDHVKGKEAYHKLDTISDNKASFLQVRYNLIHMYSVVKIRKEKLDKETKEITATYSPKVAQERIMEKKASFEKDIKVLQNKLRESLAPVKPAKEEALQKYVLTPPTPEQINLINTIKLRGVENIEDTEWSMFISALSGNYQSSQILATIAKEGGREFIPPIISLQDAEEEINLAESWLLEAIDNLLKPDDLSYRTLEILSDYEDTPSYQLFAKLDREIMTTVPSPSLSTRNRLKDAAQHALHVGNTKLFNEIWDYIRDNRDKLETTEEIQAEFIATTEELIERGMNAKEGE